MNLMLRRRAMMASGPKEQPNYLCFTALEDGTFTLTIPAGLTTANLSYVEYSANEGESWVKTNNVDSEAITITTPTIETGGKVYWRGSGVRYASSTSVYSKFSSTGTFDISGKIISLTVGKQCEQPISSVDTYIFCGIFYGCTTIINAKDCVFPNKVAKYCFLSAFNGCTNLKTAPSLPSTTTAEQCYAAMFANCSALVETPELPALSVGTQSYREMFMSCSNLTKVCNLPATYVGSRGYNRMFQSCSSIETAPNTAFTSSAREACDGMFRYCSKLTKGPTLYQLTLQPQEYQLMFGNSKLNWLKMLATDISATSCLTNWMQNVPNVSTSIFVKHINAQWTTTGASGVPTNWTVIYYDPTLDKYYTDQTKATECDDHGNPI